MLEKPTSTHLPQGRFGDAASNSAGGVYAHAWPVSAGGEQLALAAAIVGRHEQMQACRAAENFNFATHFMLQAFHKQVAAFVVCRHGRAGVSYPNILRS